jgi:hypothetical protein
MKSSATPAAPAKPASVASSAGVPKSPAATPNIHQRFHDDLAAIFAGKTTKPEDLFHPLDTVDESRERIVGTFVDVAGREFFSLWQRLKQEALHVRIPKTPAEIEMLGDEQKRIIRLAEIAFDLLWQRIHATVPETKGGGENAALKEGWQVVIEMSREDRLRQMAGEFCLPDSLRRLMARRPGPGSESAGAD